MSERDCPICFENPAVVNVGPCAHTFCERCLQRHVEENALVPTMGCPEAGCRGVVDDAIVRRLLSPTEYDKRVRKMKLLSNKKLRACPHCDTICTVPAVNSSNMKCVTCEKEFCSIHGAAHLDESCEVFTRRLAEDPSILEISRISKPCPQCSQPIELSSGCFHVTCSNCRIDFCYKCGSSDLRGTFVRKCPRCDLGYIVHRYLPLWFIAWTLLLPVWIIYSAFFLVFIGLGLLLVVLVKCKCGLEAATQSFICIFLPFIGILDLLFQVCGWSCKCGGCALPLPSLPNPDEEQV